MKERKAHIVKVGAAVVGINRYKVWESTDKQHYVPGGLFLSVSRLVVLFYFVSLKTKHYRKLLQHLPLCISTSYAQ